MARQCIRFAKLVLAYAVNVEHIEPANFSQWLYARKSGGPYDRLFMGGPEMFELILAMVFKERHALKTKVNLPGWDPVAFFFHYQMSLPIDESPFFAPLFVEKGPVDTPNLSRTPWADWYKPGMRKLGDGIPAELSLTGKTIPPTEPKPKPKPLPTPTHIVSTRLQ